MEHVAGLPSSASTRTSVGGFALAVLLHIAAGLALWWVTVDRPVLPPVEEAIEVTIEKPKPPDPPPPPEPPKPQPPPQPQAQPKPKPMPPLQGLPPPAEITADRRTQVPPSGDRPKDIAGPPPRPLDVPVPAPQPPAAAEAAEPPKPKEPPPLEQAVPQPPPPAPAVASLPPPPKEPSPVEPKPAPSPAVAAATPVPPRPQTAPAVTPPAQPRVAPQVARPQLRPPAVAHRDTPPSSSPFVNPADVRNRALASENYLWQNSRKFTFPLEEVRRGYFVKLRVVIARDGRLVSADVAQSNGTPAMDQAILAAVRRNSPYLPLPPEIAGGQATFDVPLSNY